MTRHVINPGVGYARFIDRTIVLDINVDRYWQFDVLTGDLLDKVRSGEAGLGGDADRLARLQRLGLITAHDRVDLGLSAEPFAAPALSLIEQRPVAPQRLSPAIVAEIGYDALAVRFALRWGRLARTIEATRKACRKQPARSSLEQAADLFERGMRLLPIKRVCLADSLALLRFVGRRGFAPSLIFAVEAYPFQAHCWVQQDAIVLNDVLADVQRLHPMLVL